MHVIRFSMAEISFLINWQRNSGGMYNGIGLQTPRGSGTNGYIQSNKFFVRPKMNKPGPEAVKGFEAGGGTAGLSRKPNKEILEHERKRQIELKLVVLEDKLMDQGYSEAEIADKLLEARKTLESSISADSNGGAVPTPSVDNKISETQTHQIAARKEKQMETFRAALGLHGEQSDEILKPSHDAVDMPEHAFLDREAGMKKKHAEEDASDKADERKGKSKRKKKRSKRGKYEDDSSDEDNSEQEESESESEQEKPRRRHAGRRRKDESSSAESEEFKKDQKRRKRVRAASDVEESKKQKSKKGQSKRAMREVLKSEASDSESDDERNRHEEWHHRKREKRDYKRVEHSRSDSEDARGYQQKEEGKKHKRDVEGVDRDYKGKSDGFGVDSKRVDGYNGEREHKKIVDDNYCGNKRGLEKDEEHFHGRKRWKDEEDDVGHGYGRSLREKIEEERYKGKSNGEDKGYGNIRDKHGDDDMLEAGRKEPRYQRTQKRDEGHSNERIKGEECIEERYTGRKHRRDEGDGYNSGSRRNLGERNNAEFQNKGYSKRSRHHEHGRSRER